MVCLYCKNKTRVTNSRTQKKTHNIWRRRQCLACNGTYTTIEEPYLLLSLSVHNAGHVEAFSRDKLLVSVHRSCAHRKTALADATALTATIIGRVLNVIETASIERAAIRDITHEVLARFDYVAGVHYAAHHS